MFTITKSATFCAFLFAILLSHWIFIQSASAEVIEITGFQPTEESQEAVALNAQTFPPPQQGWALDSNSIEVYPPIEAFPQPHSEIIVEFDSSQQMSIFQESLEPDFIPHTSDISGTSHLPVADLQFGILLKDVGYSGPGDMRTHLWRDHSSDLEGNGISHETLMSMPMDSVQQWHNYFHGTEHAPASP